MSGNKINIDAKNTFTVNGQVYSYYAINRGELAGDNSITR
ncbi:MAG: aconitate hydratase, partial [Psychromonas sp.]